MGQGILSLDPGLLRQIAESVGTPVYVYDGPAIDRQYAALDRALGAAPHRIQYSVKANSNLAILARLRGLGAGADIVSAGELARALRAGFDASAIVFSGVGKQREELAGAVDAGVGLINIESDAEAALLAAVAQAAHRTVACGIRVNPDVTTETHPYTQTGKAGMKFGVPLDQVLPLAEAMAAEPALELRCIGMHIGSQVADAAPYAAGARKLADLVSSVRALGVSTLDRIDVGGGLAIDYGCGPGLDPAAFAAAIAPAVETGLTLLVEPGRFLVGNAGMLLTRVLYHKRSGGREMLITDAGMNDLLRPSLYQAHHELRVVDGSAPGESSAMYDVMGPNCETGDFLALNRRLIGVDAGSLLAILSAGAYGFGMSSQYNSRPRAAEVLVEGERYAVVRRRESFDDLMRGEGAEPAWVLP